MAFCMLRIHSGVSKPASKLILPNCNLSRNVLRDVREVSDSLSWSTHSALPSRSFPGHNDKVNLSELYACDPLAILLQSRLQIYKNNSYPSQHEEGKNNTKGHKRTSRPVEHSVQHAYITTRSSHLHHALANQQNTLPLSATSFCKGPVKALFPAHRKEMITSCTTGSLVSPPSPCHTVLADSALYQDRALATPSPCCTVLAGSALYQYQALAKSSLHQCVPVPPMPQPSTSGVGGGGGGKVDPYGLPTPEQLCQVHDILIESLSNLFVRSANYKIYDPNIIFENRIRGTVTKGISMYILQSSFLVTIGHMKYAHIQFDIIKITQHPEEGTIKVRWRINGVKLRQAVFGFIKARKWSVSSVIEGTDSANWYDGFSTFYVNSAGLVSRHVADNMMPDDEKLSARQKNGLLGKLAVLFGLLPKAGHGNAMVGAQPSDIY